MRAHTKRHGAASSWLPRVGVAPRTTPGADERGVRAAGVTVSLHRLTNQNTPLLSSSRSSAARRAHPAPHMARRGACVYSKLPQQPHHAATQQQRPRHRGGMVGSPNTRRKRTAIACVAGLLPACVPFSPPAYRSHPGGCGATARTIPEPGRTVRPAARKRGSGAKRIECCAAGRTESTLGEPLIPRPPRPSHGTQRGVRIF